MNSLSYTIALELLKSIPSPLYCSPPIKIEFLITPSETLSKSTKSKTKSLTPLKSKSLTRTKTKSFTPVSERLTQTINLVEQENKFLIVTTQKPIVEINFKLNDLKSRTKNLFFSCSTVC